MMPRPLLTFGLGWLATGFGALVGSILGNAGGRRGLSLGAISGGVLGVFAAVLLARRWSWLPATETSGGVIGGLIGFAVAIPLTLTHMQSPLVPVASCGLAGAGVLLGARFFRRSQGQTPT